MKKVFTLFTLLTVLFAANAQLSITKNTIDKSEFKKDLSNNKIISLPKKHAQPNGRAATKAVQIDYPGVDDAYATVLGTDFYYDPTLLINRNWTNTNNLTHDYAVSLFDSLLYLDANNNDLPAFLPRATTTLTLDSVDVFFIHKHAIANTTFDTIRITVFDRDSLLFTGTGASEFLGFRSKVWDTVISTNTEIPLNVSNGGTPTFTGITLYPNIPFALGKSFGIKVEFWGDTANHFSLIAGFRDDCANACVASNSAANSATFTNAWYYMNATIPGPPVTNLSGINSIQFNCGPPCENWTAQNWWVYPWITANTEYSAAIVADSLRGCPGNVLNLSAFGFGSTATPFTYSWATTSGTLSTFTDKDVSLVINGNATVTVTVTDANNATTTATVSVVSRGISITITNPNPQSLACGSTINITSVITGVVTGKNYTWSNGQTGTNVFQINVNAPGTYSVTVTNNAGCSSSASVNVTYPGVTNNVNFNGPTNPPACPGKQMFFTNTTTQKNGWNPTWDMNGAGDLVLTMDAAYTYNTAGSYNVKLTMDSANCQFSITKPVNVLLATNPNCAVGFEDVEFSNAITLQPNPSTGYVTVTVNGVQNSLSVKVYNVIGSEVKTFTADEVTTTFNRIFDFNDLANGTYLMKIQSEGKVAVKRFTVSK